MRLRARKLRVESLERRRLLAGDVAVEVVDGDLVVTGDDLDNEITIEQTGSGEYEVTGLDGTTVNGETDFVAEGVDDDFRISMGGGGDSVSVIGETTVPDDLEIETGAGDDDVEIRDAVHVGDDVEIETDGGKDTVRIGGGGGDEGDDGGVRIDGETEIETGADDDSVDIRNNVDIGDDLEIETDDGMDTVRIVGGEGGVRVDGETEIETDDGDDTVNITDVLFAGAFELETGDDDDEAVICSNTFESDVELDGEDGFDELATDLVENGGVVIEGFEEIGPCPEA